MKAEFLAGAVALEQMPTDGVPEVAFIGRSNVGKSTLLNRLTKRKQLARTSGTPGRTQEINFFDVFQGSNKEPDLRLVDLPGFGYAKISKEKREKIGKLIVEYLQHREELAVVCLLNDSRRQPETEEQELRELVFNRGGTVLVVVTKMDKLKQKTRHKQLKMISKSYGLEVSDLVLTGERNDIAELWERINHLT